MLLGGNPAAVCLLTQDISDAEKQRIAAEMNLSETAFVIPKNAVGSDTTLERAFANESKYDVNDLTIFILIMSCFL